MCLSPQLRKARRLLSWSVEQVSDQSSLPASVVERAEAGDGAPDITLTQLARLQGTYEAAGVRIGHDGHVWKERTVNDTDRISAVLPPE